MQEQGTKVKTEEIPCDGGYPVTVVLPSSFFVSRVTSPVRHKPWCSAAIRD
jgi:hypothetical protein